MEILVGIFTSLLASFTKEYVGESDSLRILFVFTLSFLGAALYTIYADTHVWKTFYTVLTTAGSVYAYLILHIEKNLKEE